MFLVVWSQVADQDITKLLLPSPQRSQMKFWFQTCNRRLKFKTHNMFPLLFTSIFRGHNDACRSSLVPQNLTYSLLFPFLKCPLQMRLWKHKRPTWWSTMTQQSSHALHPPGRICIMSGWRIIQRSSLVREYSSVMEEPLSRWLVYPAMMRGHSFAASWIISALESLTLWISTSAVSCFFVFVAVFVVDKTTYRTTITCTFSAQNISTIVFLLLHQMVRVKWWSHRLSRPTHLDLTSE